MERETESGRSAEEIAFRNREPEERSEVHVKRRLFFKDS
jgi:hypothetical protein